LKRGEIDTKAKGQDTLHNSSGTWSLVRSGNQIYLQSGEDFRSSPGPDYHVYISNGPATKGNLEFNDKQHEVARLTKPHGAAYYLLKTQSIGDFEHDATIVAFDFKEKFYGYARTH
jgi:hypothetical protein